MAREHGDRRIERADVASILRDAGIFPTTPFYFVSDARYFHNPEHNPAMRDHVGYHPEIIHMLAIAKPQLLKAVISNVKDQVRRASMSGVEKPEVALLTFCKSGNHRAVAMAWMMQQALSHSRKVYSVQTFHVTEEAGLWDTRQCGPCNICRGAGFAPGQEARKNAQRGEGNCQNGLDTRQPADSAVRSVWQWQWSYLAMRSGNGNGLTLPLQMSC